MKFILILIIVFTAAFDACIASPSVEVKKNEFYKLGSNSFFVTDHSISAENADEHKSCEHENHDLCQQCHLCQHLIAVLGSQPIVKVDSLRLQTFYQFYIPSTFIKSLKRPPKV